MNSETARTDALITALIQIFAERLDRKPEEFGPQTNFFEAGGDSLMTVDISDKISNTFDIEFSLIEIFENPTPETLAERISTGYLDETFPPGQEVA